MGGTRRALAVLALTLLCRTDAASSTLEIRMAVDDSGNATTLWRAILVRRLGEAGAAAFDGVVKPLSPEEAAWAALILTRVDAWSGLLAPLQELYAPAPPPPRVALILGNRGASDGFTHDPTTIGFDLSELQNAYGGATTPDNSARIDRLFRHEYLHLMQKSWLRERPWTARTPIDEAILGMWLEGPGNYISMSDGWRARSGELSAKAKSVLAALEPRLAARLAALACAPADAVPGLIADLSQGRFDQKWGALTAALWIDREMSADPEAARKLVLAGPEGMWEMAQRNLPPPLGAVLREARHAASLCAADQGS